MDYNKESFLAGIAVGRRLKGWSGGAGDAGGSGDGMGIIFDLNPLFSYTGKVFAITDIVHGGHEEE